MGGKSKNSPEKVIQNQILEYLAKRAATKKDVTAWQQDNFVIFDPKKKLYRARPRHARPGLADISGILRGGRRLEIEVKRPKMFCIHLGKTTAKTYPSKDQKFHLEEVKAMGGVAFVARSIEDVIEELKKEGYPP